VDSFTPIMDGVTVAVRNCAYWLNLTFRPTCVVTPRIPAYTDSEPFEVIRFLSIPTVIRQPYRIGLPQLDFAFRRNVVRRGFCLLHAHSPFAAGQAALKIARATGIPIVATFHSKFRENLCRVLPAKRMVEHQIRHIVNFFQSVDRVWIPQESVAETLREYGYKGPYEIVENGTDILPPPLIAPYRERGGSYLGLSDDVHVGLYVGQLVFEKNLVFLVRSVREVADRIGNFRLVLVGRGYAKHRLRQLVKQLRLRDHVIFHDVVYDRELLMSLYARADLFLFPSFYDNAPLVIRESAAFETPSLMIHGSTAASVIRDRENGFLTSNDPKAFAGRTVALLKNPTLIERAGLGARRTLCRSWKNVAEEIQVRYLDILSKWQPP